MFKQLFRYENMGLLNYGFDYVIVRILNPKSPIISIIIADLKTHLFNAIQWEFIVDLAVTTHVIAVLQWVMGCCEILL